MKEESKIAQGDQLNSHFLEEIREPLEKALAIANKYKDNGNPVSIIVCAQDPEEETHTISVCGRGDALAELLYECFTDEKDMEMIFMTAASVIAFRGLLQKNDKDKKSAQSEALSVFARGNGSIN